ncbi:uncharacterized protein LOC108622267 [Ceratina calcarata]|uniref:Uncharacterized protein LOC108622267 n=1 Tax=Ceratina calcarata TaxID=156304 RepID=A0AAJ7IRP4_9HYME|nr:uncharacterized protein LOC108622267 [Ceratina calcarata]XP_017875529.1 uncharacterized protein LOC108622267 [Ceratina calcarata]
MSKVSGIMENDEAVGKTTLVRSVSNMLKDGSNSGPPTLFRHPSMQKIRHCCQNLNLFPYLLYSFDNSKSHPIVKKVHLCLGQFLETLTTRLFFLYKNVRRSVVPVVHAKEALEPSVEVSPACKPKLRILDQQQKRKQKNPLFLTMAVYFAPLLLILQLIGLFILMVGEKYTPGFVFLISALLCLGCISLKILVHETATHSQDRCEKSKVE